MKNHQRIVLFPSRQTIYYSINYCIYFRGKFTGFKPETYKVVICEKLTGGTKIPAYMLVQ